jgi:hypothetical protein
MDLHILPEIDISSSEVDIDCVPAELAADQQTNHELCHHTDDVTQTCSRACSRAAD